MLNMCRLVAFPVSVKKNRSEGSSLLVFDGQGARGFKLKLKRELKKRKKENKQHLRMRVSLCNNVGTLLVVKISRPNVAERKFTIINIKIVLFFRY
jgi:hypothetical protein